MNSSRKFSLGFLFLFLTFFACQKNESVVKIGAVFPLTGSIAQYGKYMQQGVELALEEAIKKEIIDKNSVKLVIEDSQADPQKSVSAFNKLLNLDGIAACIPATSAVTLALKPLANENHIVLINASAISTEIEDSSDYIFSVLPNAAFEGAFLAELAFNVLEKKNAAILYRNDQSGLSFREYFSSKFRELGGKILYDESHQPNITDFRTYAAKIESNKSIDVVFVASWGPEVAMYLKQAAELGINKQVITYETFNSPKVLEIAGSAANGVIFCGPQFDSNSNDPVLKAFREHVFQKYTQKEVNYYIASHYDAMMLILSAVSNGNTTGPSIRDFIAKQESFVGITGNIKLDENGAAHLPLKVYTVIDGNFEIYN